MARMIFLTAIGLLFCACAAPRASLRSVGALATTSMQIDREVERLMSAAKVPGLALAVIRNGRVAYVQAYGSRDIATQSPLKADTVMYDASQIDREETGRPRRSLR